MTEAHPLLDAAAQGARLEALVLHAQKRVARAGERRDRANLEVTDAFDGLETAKANLAAWLAANPDPQLSMIEGITPKGDEE